MVMLHLTDIILYFAVLTLIGTTCGAFYRLFLSPIAHIPGPKLAAVTFWYEFFYEVIRPGQFVFKIKELHKQYGEHPTGYLIFVT